MRYITIIAMLLTSCSNQIHIVKQRPNELRIAPQYFLDKHNNLLIYVPENGRFYNLKGE